MGKPGNYSGELYYEMNRAARKVGELSLRRGSGSAEEELKRAKQRVKLFRPLIWWLNDLLHHLPTSDCWVYRCEKAHVLSLCGAVVVRRGGRGK